MIVMTVLLETFLTSHSVNKAPCFVWHALSEVTLNLRGRRLWKTDIFSKNLSFSCHLRGASKQLCLLALSDRMTLLLVQWEVSATAERTAAVCTDLCSCWGLRRGCIRQKVQQPIFILGLYPPALHHPHLQFWERMLLYIAAVQGPPWREWRRDICMEWGRQASWERKTSTAERDFVTLLQSSQTHPF